MGNLTRTRAKLLFNIIDASSLTYNASPTPKTLAIKEYNIFGLPGSTLKKFKKTTTYAGIKQVAMITPDIAYPSVTSSFEWFLTLNGKTDLSNGKIDRLYLNSKTYQGYTGALAAANAGKIADADYVKLVNSMVLSINSDKSAPATASRAGVKLVLVAKDAAIKFDVGVEVIYGAVTYNGGLVASGADGSVATATAVFTSAGGAFTVDALIGSTLVITDTGSTTHVGVPYLITDNDATTITKIGNFGTTETVLDYIVVGSAAAYPKLLLAAVQREFPIRASMAGTGSENFPSAALWNKYYFKIERSGVQGAYSLDGANHLDSYIEEVEVYVPKTLAEASTGANWDDKIFDWLTANSYSDPNGDTTPWGLSGS